MVGAAAGVEERAETCHGARIIALHPRIREGCSLVGACLTGGEEEDLTGLHDDVIPFRTETLLEEFAEVLPQLSITGALHHGVARPSVVPSACLIDGEGLDPRGLVGQGVRPQLLAANAHGHVVGVPPQCHGSKAHIQAVDLVTVAGEYTLLGQGHEAEVIHEGQEHGGTGIAGVGAAVVHEGAGVIETHAAGTHGECIRVCRCGGAATHLVGRAAHAGVGVVHIAQQAGGEVVAVVCRAVRPSIVVVVQHLPGADGHVRFGAAGDGIVLRNGAILVTATGEVRVAQARAVEQQAEVPLDAAGAHVGGQAVGGGGQIKEIGQAVRLGGGDHQGQGAERYQFVRLRDLIRHGGEFLTAHDHRSGGVPGAVQNLQRVTCFLSRGDGELGFLVLTADPPSKATLVRALGRHVQQIRINKVTG